MSIEKKSLSSTLKTTKKVNAVSSDLNAKPSTVIPKRSGLTKRMGVTKRSGLTKRMGVTKRSGLTKRAGLTKRMGVTKRAIE
jgi:hypothetical protein